MINNVENKTPAENIYSLPLRYRRMENLHIIFWLFKDIAWCITFKPLGILMIFPTLIIAVLITSRSRKNISELCHNLAIVFWISANSYWMISEFFHFDEKLFFNGITGKQLALIPFSMGVMVLAWYYLWWKLKHKLASQKELI